MNDVEKLFYEITGKKFLHSIGRLKENVMLRIFKWHKRWDMLQFFGVFPMPIGIEMRSQVMKKHLKDS